MKLYKKLKYIITHGFYHPYFPYWFDLFTERHIKNRIGECIDCIECCKHIGGGQCQYINLKSKRCNIYNHRTCDIWFPVSQKELDFMNSISPRFKCKFSFIKK